MDNQIIYQYWPENAERSLLLRKSWLAGTDLKIETRTSLAYLFS